MWPVIASAIGLTLLVNSARASWSVHTRPDKPSVDWILERIKTINEAESEAIEERQKAAALIDSTVMTAASQSDFKHLSSSDLKEAKNLLMDLEDLLVSEDELHRGFKDLNSLHQGSRGSRQSRGLLDLFSSLADMRQDSSLIRGGNSTGHDERGILEFVSEVAGNILGGAISNKNDGPVLIPNHCW